MSLNMSQEFQFSSQNDFWKDIPDDILEELHAELAQQPQADNDFWNEIPATGSQGWLQSSQEITNPQINNNNYSLNPNTLYDFQSSPGGIDMNLIAPQATTTDLTEAMPPAPTTSSSSLAPPPQRPRRRAAAAAQPFLSAAIAADDDDNYTDISNNNNNNNNNTSNANAHIKTEPAAAPPPPPLEEYNPDMQKVREIINTINQAYKAQDEQLKDIEQRQRPLSVSQKDEFTQQQQLILKLNQQISSQLKQLQEVKKTFLLRSHDLHNTNALLQLIGVQQQRVELFRQELSQMLTEDDGKCHSSAALAITYQPFAQIVFKGRALEAPFSVRLLTGAKFEYANLSAVTAHLQDEESWKCAKPVDNHTAPLMPDKDNIALSARFDEVKLNVSTKMQAVTLVFDVVVTDKHTHEEITVKSPPSNPLIVITNESQWGEALGKLFAAEAFPTAETTWTWYANTLHRYMFAASMQDTTQPQRPFTDWEFRYIHTKFFGGKAKIARGAEDRAFWSWFGQVLTTVRFKRHIRQLWFSGYVYGLISKKDCSRLLASEEKGSFIIRFSDSVPGSFAVAYTTDDPSDRVKHYLVKPEDIGSNKSLPDFLKEKSQFKMLMMVHVSSGRTHKLSKEDAFRSFYSKTRTEDSKLRGAGYVQNLET